MNILKYMIFMILVIMINGCGEDKENKETAHYDIYWSSSISGSEGVDSGIYGIGGSSFDKTTKIIDLNTSINSCVVDNKGNIYWADADKKAIFKADQTGGNITEIVNNLTHPIGLAIDEERKRIYWSDWLQTNPVQTGEIGYANMDGTGQNIIITTGLSSGGHLLIDTINDKLYISDIFGSKIVRTDMEGIGVETIVIADQPSQMAIDYKNEKIIWADIGSDNISSVDFDGANEQELIAFDDIFANPSALGIDYKTERILFVVNKQDIGLTQELKSSDLNGENIETLNYSPRTEVRSLWIDNSK